MLSRTGAEWGWRPETQEWCEYRVLAIDFDAVVLLTFHGHIFQLPLNIIGMSLADDNPGDEEVLVPFVSAV